MLKLQIIFISETKIYSFPLDWWLLPWACPAFVVLSHVRYFFLPERSHKARRVDLNTFTPSWLENKEED
jgi:hypothetical protein